MCKPYDSFCAVFFSLKCQVMELCKSCLSRIIMSIYCMCETDNLKAIHVFNNSTMNLLNTYTHRLRDI